MVLEIVSLGLLYIRGSFSMSAVLQGNAPNKFIQATLHLMQSMFLVNFITASLPFSLYAMLSTGVAALTYGVCIGLYMLEWSVGRGRAKTFTHLQRVHSYALNIGFLMAIGFNMAVMPLLPALGMTSVLSIYVAGQKGLLPPVLSNWSRLVSSLFATCVLLYSGHYVSAFFAGLALTGSLAFLSNINEMCFKYALKIIGKIAEYFRPRNALSKELSSIIERSAPDAKMAFKYTGQATDLYHNIKNLHHHPLLKINSYNLQHDTDALPPSRDRVNDGLFVERFDRLDWASFHEQIKSEIRADWSSENLLALDLDDLEICKSALKKALKEYIEDIRLNRLPSTVFGTHFRANRYLDNIVFLANQVPEQQADSRLKSIYVKMAIEGGQSCSNGKIRTLEETYRNLISDADVDLPPKMRVQAVLQTNRELFFQKMLNSKDFAAAIELFGSLQDTHYYNVLILVLAPRLGLPQLSMRSEAGHINTGFLPLLMSIISPIESEYWGQTNATSLITEIQKAWLGKLTLTMKDYITWFHDFIEKLDDEESEKLKLQEMHNSYPLPEQPLDLDLIALMLLDMGVLYLDNADNNLAALPQSSWFDSSAQGTKNSAKASNKISPNPNTKLRQEATSLFGRQIKI